MKTEVERLEEKNTVLLKVEVPADVFGKAIDQAYKKIAHQITVPGFRKGKVPKTIIDNRIGEEAVLEEAVQNALPMYYVDALKESGIEPVDQPEIDMVQLEASKPLVFTAKVKVKPEVHLGEYKGVEVEKPSTEPTGDEINAQIEAIKNNFATLEPVEDRAVQNGDFALINFEGYINDEAFEGGSATDYLLEVGSGSFIPGFEDQVVEMKKGEVKDVMVTFPEDYGSEELAGKEAKFRVLLKEIKDKQLPELDDDFAKQVGFDTAEELTKDVADKIRAVKEKQSEAAVRTQVVKEVTDNAEVELHDVMVEQELDEMLEDFAHDVTRQGLTIEQYFQFTGTTPEKLREDWKDRAEDRVRSRLVLEAIASAENIEVSQEEVDNEIRKAADAAQRDFDEVKRIFESRGTIDTLKSRIQVDKTLDWLVDNAVIKEEIEEKEETKKEIEEKPSKKTSKKEKEEAAE